MNSYITKQSDHIILNVYVKINASQTKIVGVTEQGLNIAIKAKPIEGEANKELIKYLSKLLKIPQKEIELISGSKNRIKRLKLPLDTNVSLLS